MEQVKAAVKSALEKLFRPTLDTTDPANPVVAPLSQEEIDALRVFVSVRGLFPSLDAEDILLLQEAATDRDAREALIRLSHVAVDRLFLTVYGV